MEPETTDLLGIMSRLEKLERQNRRLRQAGTLVALAALCGLFMGQAPPRSRVVEAEKFVLKDANGRVRATIGMDEARHPAIMLFDDNRREVAALFSSGVVFYETLSATSNGSRGEPSAGLSSSLGLLVRRAGASVILAPEGPTLTLRDTNGFESRFGVTEIKMVKTGESRKTSAASVVMFDKQGQVIWRAP